MDRVHYEYAATAWNVDKSEYTVRISLAQLYPPQPLIDFSKNPVEHKRTKHIDIRHHFVREAITTDKVTLEHCATDEMVADPMTKELGTTKHDKHVEAMRLC